MPPSSLGVLDDATGPTLPSGLLLTVADHALVDAARVVLLQHYRPFWHTVGAAMRGRDGRIWTGIHLARPWVGCQFAPKRSRLTAW